MDGTQVCVDERNREGLGHTTDSETNRQEAQRARRLEERQAKMVARMRAQGNAVLLVERLAAVNVKEIAAAGMSGVNLRAYVAEAMAIVQSLTRY